MTDTICTLAAGAVETIDIASLPLLDGANMLVNAGASASAVPAHGMWDAIVILVTLIWELENARSALM